MTTASASSLHIPWPFPPTERSKLLLSSTILHPADSPSHRLYCGFENAIEILDVSRPGAAGFRLHTSPTRSSRSGQKGSQSRQSQVLFRLLINLRPCRDHLHPRLYSRPIRPPRGGLLLRHGGALRHYHRRPRQARHSLKIVRIWRDNQSSFPAVLQTTLSRN